MLKKVIQTISLTSYFRDLYHILIGWVVILMLVFVLSCLQTDQPRSKRTRWGTIHIQDKSKKWNGGLFFLILLNPRWKPHKKKKITFQESKRHLIDNSWVCSKMKLNVQMNWKSRTWNNQTNCLVGESRGQFDGIQSLIPVRHFFQYQHLVFGPFEPRVFYLQFVNRFRQSVCTKKKTQLWALIDFHSHWFFPAGHVSVPQGLVWKSLSGRLSIPADEIPSQRKPPGLLLFLLW